MEIKHPPSFGRAGRPRRISLSDLFLWDPAIELDLTGLSMSELMGASHPQMLSLFQDIRRKRKVSIKRAREVLLSLFDTTGFPWAHEFRRALNGEESQVSELGLWKTYIYACSKQEGQWPPKVTAIGQHFIDVEEALKAPTLAWQEHNFQRCADLLEASPVVAPYLWPGVIDGLRTAVSVEEATGLRGMVMMELMLSLIAALDVQTCVDGFADQPAFDRLFPDLSAAKLIKPNALFFDWLATYSGAGTKLASFIPQISKPEEDFDIDSARRQLRRWKSSKAFPSFDVLDAMFRKLYGDKAEEKDNPRWKDRRLSGLMATTTRRINFMMEIMERLSRFRGPVFPFGFETIQDWRASRYQHWHRHWLPLLKPSD